MAASLRNRVHSISGLDEYERKPLVRRERDYEAFDAYQERTKRRAGEARLHAAVERHKFDERHRRQKERLEQVVETQRATLVARAHETFDGNRPAHLQALEALWEQAFQGTPFERTSPKWGELGFQCHDPASDLRGAGYLGLLHLTQFLSASGPGWKAEVGGDCFPLALASLSCTAMLCRYLGLNRSLIFPGCDAVEGDPALVRSFLLLQAQDAHGHDVLQVLHVRLVRHLTWTWSQMQGPETTIMHFGEALRATYRHLHRALLATPKPWRLVSVTTAVERVDVDGPWGGSDEVPPLLAGVTTVVTFLWMLAAQMCSPVCEPQVQKKRQ